MSDRLSFYLLLIVGAAAFIAYRNGELGDWLRAKFWNTAQPAPAGKGLADALAGASSRLGITGAAGGTGGLTGSIGGTPSGPVSAAEIVPTRGVTNGMHRSVAATVERMISDARAQGVQLSGSGYRDSAGQIAARERNCGSTHYDIYEKPSSECSPPTARPGNSMHERGLAIDFRSCSDRSSTCFQWLAANAARYGFYNLPSEPWHWSTTGS